VVDDDDVPVLVCAVVLVPSVDFFSNSALNSSCEIEPSWFVSNAEKISLKDELLELSEEDEESLGGGGGGIPPGGGGGIPPSAPCGGSGGFIFLRAATSSSVLIVPLLLVSRVEKISLAELLFEEAAENSLELTEPSPSVSKVVSISAAISSKLGFELCDAEEVEEVLYDAYEL
jgi:hypothetical protein